MKVDFGLELAPLDSSHMEMVRAWRNDYRVYRWCRQVGPISDIEQAAWYERQSKDLTIRMFLIVTRFEGKKRPIGVCGLTSIDWLNRRAEFSLYLAAEHHGKGLGKEALSLLLLHGFANLNLDQIWGESMEGNPAMRTFEALGFKKDGTRRRFYLKDGTYHDAHLYSILREEWHDRLNRTADAPGASEHREPDIPGPDQDSLSGGTSSDAAEDPAPGETQAGRKKRRGRVAERAG